MVNLVLALAALQEGVDSSVPVAGVIGIMFFVIFFAIWAIVMVATFAGAWKVFVKANKPGWAAIVPIYNLVTILEISGKPLWWIFLCFIPGVNFVAGFIVIRDFVQRFGKGPGFAVGMLLLPFVFLPILGFGSARYDGR